MVSISFICLWATLLVTTNVFAAESDDGMACIELLSMENNDEGCCEDLKDLNDRKDDYSECFEDTSEGKECEGFKCLLRKENILKGEKVDEDGAAKSLDNLIKEYSVDKSVADRVKKECLDGKYEEYPPLDAKCPALQFFVCIHLNVYMECKNWKKTPACTKMSENAKKCKAAAESK